MKKDMMIGIAAGVAIAALVPLVVLVSMAGSRKSLWRAFARGGQVVTDKTRETAAEFQEIVEDMAAEMRAGATAAAVASPTVDNAAAQEPAVAAAPSGSGQG